MIQNIYMLFDRVSQSYIGSMTCIVNDAVAMRTFKAFVNGQNFPFSGMEDDIQLYKLGTIDLSSGVISAEVKFVCNLSDFKEVKNG